MALVLTPQANAQPRPTATLTASTASVPTAFATATVNAPPTNARTPSGAPTSSTPVDSPPQATPAEDVDKSEAKASADAATSLQPQQVALTVSGGISLGAYEAGLNWALLELMNASKDADDFPMDLMSMTGASAGNINAFLGAIEWFDEVNPAPLNPEANLFWDAWIPVGIDQLFPQGQTCEEYQKAIGNGNLKCPARSLYEENDAIFSRRAFTSIREKLKARVSRRYQATSRRFPVGVTVTKAEPENVKGGTLESLEVKTQRFAVLLEARVVDGQLLFYQVNAKDAGLVGNQLFLPSKNGVVGIDDILKLIEASSAFPAAFGPVTLAYCLKQHLETNGDCDPGHVQQGKQSRREAAFLDGGLFDNLPLGLALETLQVAQEGGNDQNTAPPLLMYLNPALRRHLKDPEKPPGEELPKAARGIRHLVDLVGRFISVARTYELQASIRFNGTPVDAVGTSRYLPIFGGYLGAFAGFLARPFRKFDYHVGVYDGVYTVASMLCKKKLKRAHGESPTPPPAFEFERAECLLNTITSSAKRLNIQNDSAAAFILRRTLLDELPSVVPSGMWTEFDNKHQETLDALEQTPAPNAVVKKLYEGVLAVHAEHNRTGIEPGFLELLNEIHINEADLEKQPPMTHSERALFTNRDALLGEVARNLAQRIVDIEDEEAKQKSTLGTAVAGALQFATEVYFNGQEYSPGWVWSPSTVPDGAGWVGKTFGAAWPHFATFDIMSGGAELGYLPTYFDGDGHGFTVPLAPVSWKRSEKMFGARIGASGVFARKVGVLSRAELGVYGFADYGTTSDGSLDEVALGPELAFQFFYNRIRVSTNWDALTFDKSDRAVLGDLWTIRVGIADLNGMTYWLGRALF